MLRGAHTKPPLPTRPISSPTLNVISDDLERLGYAERVPDPADRRAKLVRLTTRGREAVLVAREAIALVEQRWAQRLGAETMIQLRGTLEKLAHAIEDGG
jgi:DNA-binding MarR family transcriptional regulator